MTTHITPNENREGEIRRALGMLIEPGATHELRMLGVPGAGIVSGYFDNLDAMAEAAAKYDGRAEGIYLTLNPVQPELLARAQNRVRPRMKETTGDAHIVRRHWLAIDVDARRPSGISSSEAEHEAAIRRAQEVARFLVADRDWGGVVIADSGNGGHLLAPIDLPNDDASHTLVKRCLAALAFQFGDAALAIDESVSNAARIWKLYGTLARKGDSTAERPHRRARLLHAPNALEIVSRRKLEALAALAPRPDATRSGNGSAHAFDVDAFLSRNSIVVVRSGPWKDGAKWVLAVCPFNDEHARGEAYIVQHASGALSAGCQHNSCTWDWRELRERFEPAEHRARGTGAARTYDDEPPPLTDADARGDRDDRGGDRHERDDRGEVAASPHSDVANGLRIVSHFGQDLCWVPGFGWHRFDGRLWRESEEAALLLAQRLGRIILGEAAALQQQAAECADSAKREQFANDAKARAAWAKASEMRPRYEAALHAARGHLLLEADRLDGDLMLFAVANGVIDLRTGTLREARRDDYLTRAAPVKFDARATCPRFEKFLNDIYPGSPELVQYDQRLAGLCLTGDVSEQALFFFYGDGENGKTTRLEIAEALLGPYCIRAPADLLTAAQGERHPTELADLRGARLVICSEIEKGRRWAVQRLKELTGEKRIRARRVKKDFTEFAMTGKVVVMANTRPSVPEGSGRAFWRRIRLVPFVAHFPPGTADKKLSETIIAEELSGILNWALEGLRQWREHGLGIAPEIEKAVADYRRESADVGLFVEQLCERGPDLRVRPSELWAAFAAWAGQLDRRAPSMTDFKIALAEMGFSRGPVHGYEYWKGIDLRRPSTTRGEG